MTVDLANVPRWVAYALASAGFALLAWADWEDGRLAERDELAQKRAERERDEQEEAEEA